MLPIPISSTEIVRPKLSCDHEHDKQTTDENSTIANMMDRGGGGRAGKQGWEEGERGPLLLCET